MNKTNKFYAVSCALLLLGSVACGRGVLSSSKSVTDAGNRQCPHSVVEDNGSGSWAAGYGSDEGYGSDAYNYGYGSEDYGSGSDNTDDSGFNESDSSEGVINVTSPVPGPTPKPNREQGCMQF